MKVIVFTRVGSRTIRYHVFMQFVI